MEKSQIYEILNEDYFSEEKHEKEVIDNLHVLLSDVDIFVDVGASLGQYVFFANEKMREGGRIIAIEADPIRFEELERNCRKWESLSNNKLTAINGAICDRDGKIKFYTTKTNISGGLFKHEISQSVLDNCRFDIVNWNEIIVNSFKLDTLLCDCIPDLIKVDVEGVELRLLKGTTRILSIGKTKFLIEIHDSWIDPEGQKNSNEVYKFMKSFGYFPKNFFGQVLFVKLGLLESFPYRLKIIGKLILQKFS